MLYTLGVKTMQFTTPFVNKLLQNNLHFSCVFGSNGFYPSCQLFTALMPNGRQAYLA